MSTHLTLGVYYLILPHIAKVNGIDDAANSGRKRRRATVSTVNSHCSIATILHYKIRHLSDISVRGFVEL